MINIILYVIFIGGTIVLLCIAGSFFENGSFGGGITYLLIGLIVLCLTIFTTVILYEDHLIKYIPNLEELYEDGKILEAEQKLEEMKLERLNIED